MIRFFLILAFVAILTPSLHAAEPTPVSFHKQILPIFQAHCQGCHQPAKAGGDYIMTTFDKLLAGGESGKKAVVAKQPASSHLLALITPKDGKAKMPQGKRPLTETDITLIQRWISEGAGDDTPANAREKFDLDHPPVYTHPPVISSIDFSPDGKVLAVAGFHEVLLTDPDTGKLLARLIGISERIQAVRFSPNGKRLAVSGGQPARLGEIQVWDVDTRKLRLSHLQSHDTLYGACWSPDGTKIAYGCTDNTVRVIDAESGEQVCQQASHEDWILDTTFTKNSDHVISVSRDMTAKLTEIPTQRFIDNITSITPGALKGGVQAVVRHPKNDEIFFGGSDGTPKHYRVFRTSARKIGDDANMIKLFTALPGRIFGMAVTSDAKRLAAVSGLDGKGSVAIYEVDTGKELGKASIPTSALYAVAFHPKGDQLAVAGADGSVRLVESTSGKVLKEFSPAPLAKNTANNKKLELELPPEDPLEPEKPAPAGQSIVELQVLPAKIGFTNRFDYAQLVVAAKLASGELVDVTRSATIRSEEPLVKLTKMGLVRPHAEGKTSLTIQAGGQTVKVPVEVSGLAKEFQADYIRDVNPVLSRMGCNAGMCHGAAKGKNGFKLSLRGYDAIMDVRSLSDDLATRRMNLASPDDSLMLLKTTGAAPHVGGQLTRPGEPHYEIIRNWIANGATLNLNTPRVTKVEVFPKNPIVQQLGQRQQLRVLATFADEKVRDVTQEAFVESGDTEVATAHRGSILTAVRRGESPVLVRYEGAYDATTLTVMGDRKGFEWKAPPVNNKIDELLAAKWQRLKIQPSELCGDDEFLRRIHLDLTGLPPTADEVRKFLADTRDSKVKRDEVVDRLVGSKDFVEFWTNKWADLLQVNRKFLGAEGAALFRKWIQNEVEQNTPYDEFVRKVLMADGSNKTNPPASYYKILRDPATMMENTTHLFLAVRFNCNKCHDHPFERWTQDQYYETAAYFARTSLKADPAAGNATVGGTAVEGAKALYEIVYEKPDGEVKHDRTNEVAPPKFPYEVKHPAVEKASRREQLAAWITAGSNPYFAKSYVNRLWGYLFGAGIIEPIDDIRAGNPPSNPELLDYLAVEFIASKFDMRHIVKLICKSRSYQLSVASNSWNEDDKFNFSRGRPRRLPAEVLLDSLYSVTGSQSKFPGVQPGTRAAALPDSGVELPTGFLGTFGRPARESSCECERSNSLQLGPVMALVNGQTLAEAIGDPNNAIAKLVAAEKDDAKVVNELFLRILNRPATPAEIKASLDMMSKIEGDHQKLIERVKAYEAASQEKRTQAEKNRQVVLNKAKEDLAAYEKLAAPKIAAAEKQRLDSIAKAQADLKQHEDSLDKKFADWEKTQQDATEWVPLKPTSAKTGIVGLNLQPAPDGSIFVDGKPGKGQYTITVNTDLTEITGVRLECLADPRLPKNGPGRSKDGNFVINQVSIAAASIKDAKQTTKIGLQNPKASFSQESFRINEAVDGQVNGAKGWAVSPNTGMTHWAVFETTAPVGYAGGTTLTFTFENSYGGGEYLLGKFRLSVTRAKLPLPLGLAEEYKVALAQPPEKRDPKVQDALSRVYKVQDRQLQSLKKALSEVQKPLPPDGTLTNMQATVAELSKPTPEDPQIARLKLDVETSLKQMANKRLTGAQDVAWALINSPAFLFNR